MTANDERAPTAAAFWTRATAFFAVHGIVVQRVLTDNAQVYRRTFAFRTAVPDTGAVQRFTQPCLSVLVVDGDWDRR